MGTFLQDLRFGARTLAKAPGFTFIAILTLALGIGANSALFSVVNGVLLNPLPYPEPDRLVAVYASSHDFEQGSVTYLNYLDWEKDNQSFAHLGLFRDESLFMTGVGEGERVRAYMISASFFPALGIQPSHGRLLRPEEDRIGGTPVAMISDGLWMRKFGGSQDIIGKSITLTGKSYEVIGIIPASFTLYGKPREVYIPIGQWADATFRDRHVSMGSNVIGRLKPGVTLTQAKGDMNRIAKNLAETYPDSNKGMGINLLTLKKDMVGEIAPFLYVLLGAVGFVLLIACSNVANLLLARATGRTREFAVRAALGATRMRVIRQLLTESVLLAAAGGALGLTVAYWGTRGILGALPQVLPRVAEVGLDSHVLLFTMGISVMVGVIFGLVPALRMSRTSLQETLKEGGRGMSATRHRTQSVFVVVEMAMALVLLAGAGLMFRTLSALWSVDPGFNPHNVITFDMTMPRGVAGNPQAQRTLLRNIHDTLVAIPGVHFASLQGGSLPMNGDSELPFWIEGQPKPATQSEMSFALFYLVEPEYLKAMGTPLLRGRFLTDQDNEHSQPVVVIDEVFAQKHFKDQDPIGKRLNLGIVDTQPVIVGVAGHVKHWGLDSDATSKIREQIYIPFMQLPDRFMPLLADGVGLVARVQNTTSGITGTIQHTMARMSSEQVVYAFQSMEEIVSDSLAARRFSMILLGVFAGLALLLASVGIYGVISYVVGQRTHEIGIRMALGAQRRDVLRLVLRQGAVMALVGVVIGLGATYGLTRLMATMLFQVSATDPLTLAGVSVVLTAVSLLACYIPARRAMRTDPVIALRYE
jgi:predicted permease